MARILFWTGEGRPRQRRPRYCRQRQRDNCGAYEDDPFTCLIRLQCSLPCSKLDLPAWVDGIVITSTLWHRQNPMLMGARKSSAQGELTARIPPERNENRIGTTTKQLVEIKHARRACQLKQ